MVRHADVVPDQFLNVILETGHADVNADIYVVWMFSDNKFPYARKSDTMPASEFQNKFIIK